MTMDPSERTPAATDDGNGLRWNVSPFVLEMERLARGRSLSGEPNRPTKHSHLAHQTGFQATPTCLSRIWQLTAALRALSGADRAEPTGQFATRPHPRRVNTARSPATTSSPHPCRPEALAASPRTPGTCQHTNQATSALLAPERQPWWRRCLAPASRLFRKREHAPSPSPATPATDRTVTKGGIARLHAEATVSYQHRKHTNPVETHTPSPPAAPDTQPTPLTRKRRAPPTPRQTETQKATRPPSGPPVNRTQATLPTPGHPGGHEATRHPRIQPWPAQTERGAHTPAGCPARQRLGGGTIAWPLAVFPNALGKRVYELTPAADASASTVAWPVTRSAR